MHGAGPYRLVLVSHEAIAFMLMISISTVRCITSKTAAYLFLQANQQLLCTTHHLHVVGAPAGQTTVLPLPDPARLSNTADRARPAAACSLLVCASIGR